MLPFCHFHLPRMYFFFFLLSWWIKFWQVHWGFFVWSAVSGVLGWFEGRNKWHLTLTYPLYAAHVEEFYTCLENHHVVIVLLWHCYRSVHWVVQKKPFGFCNISESTPTPKLNGSHFDTLITPVNIWAWETLLHSTWDGIEPETFWMMKTII